MHPNVLHAGRVQHGFVSLLCLVPKSEELVHGDEDDANANTKVHGKAVIE